jgi:tetratricopeptide (TPR) repeat protein
VNSKESLNLARGHFQAGQLGEAEKLYRRILEGEPDQPEAIYFLGMLAGRRGDVDGAIAAFRKVLAVSPNFFAAQASLGDALGAKGLIDEALAALGRAAQLNPNVAEIHNNIGELLFKKGRFEEAAGVHLQAVRLKPDFALAWFRLGHAYRAIGDRRLEDALAAYRQAVKLKPDMAAAYLSMAVILANALRFEEALECHARAAALRPDAAHTQEAMGVIMLRQKGGAAAVEHFRRAVAADPGLFSSWNYLGVALRGQGLVDEARDCFRRMLALRPDSVLAHSQLVGSSRGNDSEKEIEPLSELLRRADLTAEQRINAEFAMGTALDDVGRFDEAFDHFAKANSLMKERRAQMGDRYEPQFFHDQVDRLIETFTPEFFEQRRSWGEPSELPVFVVGMPRSGTTLVHQIVASHPKVHGAGELNHIAYILSALENNDARRTPSTWAKESLNEAAQKHLRFLQSLDPDALRVIDKLPKNLHHLGPIALLFPAARVVFCCRDPRDTCLSCYFQEFNYGNTFSFDLIHCAQYHVENDRLMNHWPRILPLKMLKVQYEDVVADLEGQSRRLIDFLGLPWDSACLEFHRAQTTVFTSSVWQVRQPIYQKSVGRWRNYEGHLGGMMRALGS